MDAIFIQDGRSMDYTPASDVSAGDVVVVGRAVAIAREDIAANELGSLGVEGVYEVPKAAETQSQGDWLYWDAGNGYAEKSTSGDLSMGYCFKDAASGDATVWVKLVYLPAGLSS